MSTKLPTLYIPHGGGPCFFMDWKMGPPDTWDRMRGWLEALDSKLPESPRALLVISGHWEEPVPTVTSGTAPSLIYDYYGFPPHTYELKWPAPGAPELATRVVALLQALDIEARADAQRGFDHGVFIPLKVSYPDAHVPTVQLSLKNGLDPEQHLAIGRALAPLRNEAVLIVGSGMSYHNMRGFNTKSARADSVDFDEWLTHAVTDDARSRDAKLRDWARAPRARASHPREEHLLPLMVAAGAGELEPARRTFTDEVMGVVVSAFQFG